MSPEDSFRTGFGEFYGAVFRYSSAQFYAGGRLYGEGGMRFFFLFVLV